MIDISIKNLDVYYDNYKALEDINIDIYKNDFLAVIGPNGGGKSTLIKSIVGLQKYQKGTIECDEKHIGYVPQHANFDKGFPISVIDVILLGAIDKRIRPFAKVSKDVIERANSLLEKLHIDDVRDKEIGSLSGGQFQKVLIARALVNRPKILILDEPTSSIDQESKIDIFNILRELNKDMTVVVVTHAIKDIYPYINSVAMIDRQLMESKRALNKDSKELIDLCGCRSNFYDRIGR